MLLIRKALILCLLAMAMALPSQGQFYTGSKQEFGKNRVQYRDFNWIYFPGEKFEVYHYQGGRDLASYTLQSATANLVNVESVFDYTLDEKIQIIVYNKQSEFRQSNIGLSNDDQYNIGGSTRIIGSKMFVYYQGDHALLDQEIRANIARVIFSQMMYGGDWKDVIKNSTLLTVPTWFEEGIVSYASKPWEGEVEARVFSAVEAGNYEKFNRLSGDEAAYAGHALWKYIADVYGENVIPNILYMTKISRNIESGFLFVLGTSLNSLSEDFLDYYKDMSTLQNRNRQSPELAPIFNEKQANGKYKRPEGEDGSSRAEKRWQKKINKLIGELPVKHKSKYTYSQFKLSPDGKHLAFATNELGQYKVWLYDLEKGKCDRIYKREYRLQRIIDNSFPIITWHPTGEVLAFTFEKKGRAFIGNYYMADNKVVEKELFRIDKVVDFDYSADGRKMIFSGVREGQTDLYLYQVIGNNQQQLTNDPYDDLNPRFLPNSERIIFASNRPDDTLRTITETKLFDLNKDIYILDPNNSRLLERITSTADQDESNPDAYDDKNFTYLGNAGGVLNRYAAYVDSTISHIDTSIHYRSYTVSSALSNFVKSPLEYDHDFKSGTYSLLFYEDNRYQYFQGNIADDRVVEVGGPNAPADNQANNEGVNSDTFFVPKKKDDGREVNIDDYQFSDDSRDYEYEKQTIKINELQKGSTASLPTDSSGVFTLPKTKNYELNFATDYVLSQLDNSFGNAFYQTFSSPTSATPGLSGLVKLGVSDLFEDFKIVGGFRLSGDLENNDYGLSFHNLSGRLDKKITAQRQGQRRVTNQSIVQVHTHSFQYEISWPFNELLALKGTGIYRNDREVALSTDPNNLRKANVFHHNLGVRVALVFDNTINRGLNLYNGSRAKIWAERYQEPTVDASDFTVLGMDFRHYLKIHRDLIAAFRLAGNTSLGNRKLVSYLGGVDNWLFQRVDNSTEIANNQGYMFQTLASPLRGFWVNARNGSTFAVANAELRWPVFKYLLNKPIKSDFVENFQMVGFADVGSAWTGLHPYSEDNEFNTQSITTGAITVTIENNREPIIYGYGFGFRSRLLGYFVRADWAWGVDDGIALPRVFYFSLNLDF
jgi:Tol biopolymer transport system component